MQRPGMRRCFNDLESSDERERGKKQISSKLDSNCGSQCDKSSGTDEVSLTIMEIRIKRVDMILAT